MAWYDWAEDKFKYLSDPGHFFLKDPQDAKDTATAAAGARGVAGQSQAFSEEQWRRMMEGLGGALGSYGPSQDYWNNNIGNQGPGAMEQWWQQNQQGFQGPTNQQTAYNGYNAWMNDPWNNATRQGQMSASQYLGGNTASNDAYYANRDQLSNYSGPQNTQSAYNLANLSLRSPGAGEDWYSQNQQRYNTGGAARDVYDLYSGQLTRPSQSEQTAQNASRDIDNAVAGSKQQMEAYRNWGNGQTAGQRNEAENKGYVRAAGDVSNYAQSQLGALSGPGQYEQFISADISGDNPLYQRTKDRGVAQINQEMARRGGFQAPAAIDRIGNYTAELDAQDYDRRRQAAQAAQQMQLARIGQGTQTMQASSANKMAQGQALQGMDVQNEAGELGRKNFGMQASQNAFQNELAGKQFGMQAAGQADQSALARLQGLQGMASAGDQSTLGFLNAGQNAASDAQNQMLARLMGNLQGGNMADQTKLASDQQQLARLLGQYNMAQGADQSNLARANQIFNMGQGVDQSMLARYAQQMQGAQSTDQFDLARLLGGGQMAGNAQSAQQQRVSQAMASIFGLNDAQAGQYGKFYGMGAEESGKAFEDAMSSLMQSYGYQVAGSQSEKDRQAEKQAGLMKLLGALFG